jgi:hypothetical protein
MTTRLLLVTVAPASQPEHELFLDAAFHLDATSHPASHGTKTILSSLGNSDNRQLSRVDAAMAQEQPVAHQAESKPEPSEYEKRRQENIARKNSLLRALQNQAQLSGLLAPSDPKPVAPRKTNKKRPAKEQIQPVRASPRLRGLKADTDVTVKREAEETAERRQEEERNNRRRVPGTLTAEEIYQRGGLDANGSLLDGLQGLSRQLPWDAKTAKETSDTELKSLIENFSKLSLWANVHPGCMCLAPLCNVLLTISDMKLTPERAVRLVYNLASSRVPDVPSTPSHFIRRSRKPSYSRVIPTGILPYSTALILAW